MKKLGRCAISGLLIVCFLSICYAEQTNAINRLNNEVQGIYGIENHFQENAGPYGAFNMEVLTKYNIPVYGYPDSPELTSVDTYEPRFIGVNDYGESVPNPKFPADSLTHTSLNEFDWIENPYDEPIVNQSGMTKRGLI